MTPLASLTIVSVVNEVVATAQAFNSFASVLEREATDFDFVLVANAVETEAALTLKALVAAAPDTTVVFLGEKVHDDLARLVGVEHAVGDYVLFCDMALDDPVALPALLAELRAGYDLVIGDQPGQVYLERPLGLQLLFVAYAKAYAALTGIRLELRPTGMRVLSRAAALFLAGRPNSELIVRARSIGPGFPAIAVPLPSSRTPVRRATARGTHTWSKGISMLLSVSTLPLRGASYAALIGGALSALYSVYVFGVYLFKQDVAAGWTTLSLQLALMMFVFSFVLLFIGEYVMQIHSASPPRSRRYLVLREMRSPLSRRTLRLNIVDADGRFQLGQPTWLAPDRRDIT